jgi:HD-like signal output (HDOD) protein
MSLVRDIRDLEEVLANAQLPALPQSAIKLLELSKDPANGPADYAKPIEADAGLMSQVLRFVNSSYFGFSREIACVQQAITLVGVRTVKNFALWNAVFSVVPNPTFGPFDLKNLWQDSLRRAVFARMLGRRLKLHNSEDLFAAALLQDIAIPMLLKSLPEQYENLIRRRTEDKMRLSSLERETFGWDHAEAAAALVRSWHLPEEFAVLIERHPSLEELLACNPPKLDASCVALAALLPACKDQDWSELNEFTSGLEKLAPGASDKLSELLELTDKQFTDFAPMLKLPCPPTSLVAAMKAQQESENNG